MTTKRILLVEDEIATATDEREMLEDMGYLVTAMVDTADKALRSLNADTPDLVLMDIVLRGDADGIELAESIRRHYDVPVVFVTAFADEQFIARAKLTEPFGYVVKPFDPQSLASNIEIALYKHSVDQKLRESEENYRSLIEFTNVVHWKVDMATERFVYVSPQIESLLGYPATTWTDIDSWMGRIHPDDREKAVQYCYEKSVAGEDHDFEYRAIAADGRIIWIRDTVSVVMDEHGPRELVGYMSEVTRFKDYALEKEQLQRELQQARKMEALGQLTGGIAHDFNNIQTIIMGYTGLARSASISKGDAKLTAQLDRVLEASERARNLVAQMLAFSRGETGNDKPLQLQPLIKEDLKMLRSTLPSSIEITTEMEENLPAVLMDPGQLNQLLMNLCVNARDAMAGTGDLTICLGLAKGVEAECATCYKQLEGDWVALSISDTGSGIQPDILDRIFDPFYTTKDVGKGTGMGLSVIHGIMHNHGGHVLVETEMGKDTTFRLLFPPVVEEAVETQTAVSSSTDLQQGHGEHVLIVDDEPDLGDLIGDLLERCGYQPTVLTSSKKALELFKKTPNKFALVITDQTMPEITGKMLIKNLRAVRPGLPVILCTGFSEDIDAEDAERMGIHYLEKPVRIENMIQAVGEMLRPAKQNAEYSW